MLSVRWCRQRCRRRRPRPPSSQQLWVPRACGPPTTSVHGSGAASGAASCRAAAHHGPRVHEARSCAPSHSSHDPHSAFESARAWHPIGHFAAPVQQHPPNAATRPACTLARPAPAMRAPVMILGLLLVAWPAVHARQLKQGECRLAAGVLPQPRRCRQTYGAVPWLPPHCPASWSAHKPMPLLPLPSGLLGGACGTVNPDDFCACCADKGGSDSDDSS